MINSLSGYIGGKGGGQSFFAVAGGSKVSGVNDALDEARKLF